MMVDLIFCSHRVYSIRHFRALHYMEIFLFLDSCSAVDCEMFAIAYKCTAVVNIFTCSEYRFSVSNSISLFLFFFVLLTLYSSPLHLHATLLPFCFFHHYVAGAFCNSLLVSCFFFFAFKYHVCCCQVP